MKIIKGFQSLFWVTIMALCVLLLDFGLEFQAFSGKNGFWRTICALLSGTWFVTVIYAITIYFSYRKKVIACFLPVFLFYPYGYEMFTLIGHVGVAGLSWWMAYAIVFSHLIFCFVAFLLLLYCTVARLRGG